MQACARAMLAPASARLQAGGGSSTRMRPARCAAATLRMQAFKAESEKGAQVPLPVAAPVPGARGLAGYHHSPSKTGYAFFMPALSLLGPNALKAAGKEITKLGLKKALIVTDKVMAESEAMGHVKAMLKEAGAEHVVYSGTQPNPTVEQVEEGLELLRSAGADFLLSFGGGSPHDCAKAIGIVASNGGSIRDYEGLDRASKPMLPLLSVNTTAGTAAEMTRFWESVSETNQSFCPWWFLLTCSIITDTARHVKMAIIDSKVTPTIAVDDPLLMLGMPKGLTAATGMDALTHSIEAYLSTSSNRITDACALHAMRLISRYLRTAVGDPGNVQAHDMMCYAQYLAGMAFNSASLGYVHAMAHQLGGFYNLPHGVCNALLLPVVLEFNAKAVPHLFLDIAEALGCELEGEDGAEAGVKAALGAVRSLARDVGIPPKLKELGVNPEDFDTLAGNAMKDACGLTNPREPSHQEVVALFKQAYEQH